MRKEIHNPLILLEASRRIELLYTDLQSAASPLRQLAATGVIDQCHWGCNTGMRRCRARRAVA